MDGTLTLLAALGIAALLFLALRSLVLWYWRVDEAIALLREISASLARLEQRPPAPEKPTPQANDPRAALYGGPAPRVPRPS